MMEDIGSITAPIARDIAQKAGVTLPQFHRAQIEGVLQKCIEREWRISIREITAKGYYSYPEDWVLNGGKHPYAKNIELIKAEKILRDRGDW